MTKSVVNQNSAGQTPPSFALNVAQHIWATAARVALSIDGNDTFMAKSFTDKKKFYRISQSILEIQRQSNACVRQNKVRDSPASLDEVKSKTRK